MNNSTINRKQKVTFFLQMLHIGGAENVALKLMQNFDRDRFIVHLVLINKEGELLKELPGDVEIIDLAKKSGFDFFRLIKKFRKYLKDEQPSAVISFLTYTNIINLIAVNGLKNIKTYPSDRTALKPSLEKQRITWLKTVLVKRYYPRATRVIPNSIGIKKELAEMLSGRISSNLIQVFPNPIDINRIIELSNEDIDIVPTRPYLINVGRCVDEKAQDILIKAFSTLRREIDIDLVIVGDGDRRSSLMNLANDLDIRKFVHFKGSLKNPFPLLKNAKCFVMSSKREGFPNAMLEAMVLGIPVVSTDCDFGPSELIQDGENGLLTPVGNAEQLSRVIKRVLGDEELAKKFSKNGLETVKKYEIKKIVKEFEDLVTG